jgi:hypothetical protein
VASTWRRSSPYLVRFIYQAPRFLFGISSTTTRTGICYLLCLFCVCHLLLPTLSSHFHLLKRSTPYELCPFITKNPPPVAHSLTKQLCVIICPCILQLTFHPSSHSNWDTRPFPTRFISLPLHDLLPNRPLPPTLGSKTSRRRIQSSNSHRKLNTVSYSGSGPAQITSTSYRDVRDLEHCQTCDQGTSLDKSCPHLDGPYRSSLS